MTDRPQTIATAQMLIRRPISVVFDAFVEPAITSRFWFSRGGGRLDSMKVDSTRVSAALIHCFMRL